MNESTYIDQSQCHFLFLVGDSISFRYLPKGLMVDKDGWYFATEEDVINFRIPPRSVEEERTFLVNL